jgi:hypothetical protein
LKYGFAETDDLLILPLFERAATKVEAETPPGQGA